MADLVLSDAETVLSKFNNQVDCVIFDPPYGIGNKKLVHKDKNWNKSSENWDQFDSVEEQYQSYLKHLSLIKDAMKDTGNLFIFGSFHNIYQCGEIIQRQLGMKIVNSITWCKENAFFNITQSGLIESTEHIIWAAKTKDYYFNYEASKTFANGKQLRNYWISPITPNSERVGHPHQKPIWLIQRLLEFGCPGNGLVVDPMCGSGTTAVVAKKLRIRAVCCDIDKKYYNEAQERLNNCVNIFE